MMKDMQHCLIRRPPHIRISKWRLNYGQANRLAHEVHGMQGLSSPQSPADILMTMIDGKYRLFDIPVEVKPISGCVTDPWLVDEEIKP